MTIHFVYASIPGISPLKRLYGKTARLAQLLGLPLSYVGPRDSVDSSGWPSRAPLSITHHLLGALRMLGPLRFYDWRERVVIRPEPGDILIGHPHPSDQGCVFNRSCADPAFSAKIALMPLSHGLPEFSWGYDAIIEKVDRVIAITGPYWRQTWKDSALSHWAPKIIGLDMAVDIKAFPRVKLRFSPKGRRKFFYIGYGDPIKGTHLLSILFKRAEGRHRCLWVGADNALPYLEKRPFGPLGPAQARALADECDIFLSMGVSDANPTTLLEALAWGFPVACTPQSGYPESPLFSGLSLTDMEHNLKVLDSFQQADETTLVARADKGRELVESTYTFSRFTSAVVSELQRLQREGSV